MRNHVGLMRQDTGIDSVVLIVGTNNVTDKYEKQTFKAIRQKKDRSMRTSGRRSCFQNVKFMAYFMQNPFNPSTKMPLILMTR